MTLPSILIFAREARHMHAAIAPLGLKIPAAVSIRDGQLVWVPKH